MKSFDEIMSEWDCTTDNPLIHRLPLISGWRKDLSIAGYSLVDASFYAKWACARWVLTPTGYGQLLMTKDNRERLGVTAHTKGKPISFYLHRVVLFGLMPSDLHADHIDGDRLNNVSDNLREATQAENNRNTGTKPKRLGKYKGVESVLLRSGSYSYVATIRAEGITYRLGSFKCAKAAAKAYDLKAKELHGAFAKTNAILYPDDF